MAKHDIDTTLPCFARPGGCSCWPDAKPAPELCEDCRAPVQDHGDRWCMRCMEACISFVDPRALEDVADDEEPPAL